MKLLVDSRATICGKKWVDYMFKPSGVSGIVLNGLNDWNVLNVTRQFRRVMLPRW